MSFNFIKLENRKYELTPSTSEPELLSLLAWSSRRSSQQQEEEMTPGQARRQRDAEGCGDALMEKRSCDFF